MLSSKNGKFTNSEESSIAITMHSTVVCKLMLMVPPTNKKGNLIISRLIYKSYKIIPHEIKKCVFSFVSDL